jgi:hypothetical protein
MFVVAFLDEMLVKKLPAISEGRFTDEQLDEILQQVQHLKKREYYARLQSRTDAMRITIVSISVTSLFRMAAASRESALLVRMLTTFTYQALRWWRTMPLPSGSSSWNIRQPGDSMTSVIIFTPAARAASRAVSTSATSRAKANAGLPGMALESASAWPAMSYSIHQWPGWRSPKCV